MQSPLPSRPQDFIGEVHFVSIHEENRKGVRANRLDSDRNLLDYVCEHVVIDPPRFSPPHLNFPDYAVLHITNNIVRANRFCYNCDLREFLLHLQVVADYTDVCESFSLLSFTRVATAPRQTGSGSSTRKPQAPTRGVVESNARLVKV